MFFIPPLVVSNRVSSSTGYQWRSYIGANAGAAAPLGIILMMFPIRPGPFTFFIGGGEGTPSAH